jgi:acetoacetate decarboxylase
MAERGAIAPGSGTPLTASGRSIAYGPAPWRMRGRTLALWYRLADPDEARRHVPPTVVMEDDPVVRARFWDMQHDGLGERAADGSGWTTFREAVVAFPVSHGTTSGDYPTYMYGDDFAYNVFGREVMGWPVRDGEIEVDPVPPSGPAAGLTVTGVMTRGGRELMRATLRLTGEHEVDEDIAPPVWLATKVIPDATGPRVAVAQLLATGPERLHHRVRWTADATLSMGEAPGDELHRLAPREIVRAEYWADVSLTIGWGRVLDELDSSVWADS